MSDKRATSLLLIHKFFIHYLFVAFFSYGTLVVYSITSSIVWTLLFMLALHGGSLLCRSVGLVVISWIGRWWGALGVYVVGAVMAALTLFFLQSLHPTGMLAHLVFLAL